MTVSVGYTGINSSDTIPDIVGRADDALYFAKENGRNQVSSYERLLASGKVSAREAPNSDIELF